MLIVDSHIIATNISHCSKFIFLVNVSNYKKSINFLYIHIIDILNIAICHISTNPGPVIKNLGIENNEISMWL